MRFKYFVGISLCTLTFLLTGFGVSAESTFKEEVSTEVEREVIKITPTVIELEDRQSGELENEVVMGKAVDLNTDILLEIEKMRELMRLEQEELEREKLEKQELEQQILEQQKLWQQNINTMYNDVINMQYLIELSNTTELVGYAINQKTNLTPNQLEQFLYGTELAGLGEAYFKAEQMYNVSSLALIGISGLESNWGRSNIAKTKNNLFGYQAYDSNTDAAKVFETREEGILTVARHLSKNYLREGAMYFNGYTLEGVNVRYASDKNWNIKITNIMNKLLRGGR